MKRLIALRKRVQAFGRGSIEFLLSRQPQGARLHPRATGDERMLVVANLSRFVQYVELDLAAHNGSRARRDVRAHAVPHRSATGRTC